MTREEHLGWCKQRSLEYVEIGNYQEAMTSMFSDLDKHPETANHPGSQLGLSLMIAGQLNDEHSVRKFINGFN